jgi:hypothetical protein
VDGGRCTRAVAELLPVPDTGRLGVALGAPLVGLGPPEPPPGEPYVVPGAVLILVVGLFRPLLPLFGPLGNDRGALPEPFADGSAPLVGLACDAGLTWTVGALLLCAPPPWSALP